MKQSFLVGLPEVADRPVLTVYPEVANLLGISKQSAYDAAARGEIPTLRVGRRLLVPTAALRRLLLVDDAPARAAGEPAGSPKPREAPCPTDGSARPSTTSTSPGRDDKAEAG